MSNVTSTSGKIKAAEPIGLWDALAGLDRREATVLCALWGIGRAPISDREVAAELGVTVEQVWEMHEFGAAELGFRWCTSHRQEASLKEVA